MTKPTGRPKGRPKTREYVTLMARVPLELVEQARKYAARKQQPISEVLRDGLLLLLEQEDTAPHYVYDSNTPPVKVSDTKEDTTRTLEALQALQPVKVSDTKEADTLPSFDTAKHHLGKLCPGSHEWGTTGQTLLNNQGQCAKCKAQGKREKRKAKRAAQSVAG